MVTKKKDVFKTGSKGLLSMKKKVKKTPINLEAVEQGVKKIHTLEEEEKEKTSKASVILPRSLYKQMKVRVVDLDTTVTDYFTELLKKDLGI